jgi:hypothetical protein
LSTSISVASLSSAFYVYHHVEFRLYSPPCRSRLWCRGWYWLFLHCRHDWNIHATGMTSQHLLAPRSNSSRTDTPTSPRGQAKNSTQQVAVSNLVLLPRALYLLGHGRLPYCKVAPWHIPMVWQGRSGWVAYCSWRVLKLTRQSMLRERQSRF